MATELTKTFVLYQAQTRLLELAFEVAEIRKLAKPEAKEKLALAVKIRLWSKALSYSDYLEQSTVEKLVYCLAELCDANAIPYAPVITAVAAPSIITGGSTTIVNNYYSSGTSFINSDVDAGVETADSFSIGTTYGAIWHYVIRSGGNQRTGILTGAWLSDGSLVSYSEDSTEDLGDTTPIELSVDFNSGSIRLRATTSTDNWVVSGTRFTIS